MIRHLFKLVWNRKKTHALIMLEILLSFVVVFALLASAIHFSGQYRQPLGYEYEDVWAIVVDRNTRTYDWEPDEAQRFRRLRRELETMEPVLHVASADNSPFSGSQNRWGWDEGERAIRTEVIQASATFDDVLGMRLVQGRWFETADDALGFEPIVVDRQLAEDLFGDEDPIDREIEGGPEVESKRIVGVVDSFRRSGHFAEPTPMMFLPAHEEMDDGVPTRRLLVKLVANTPPIFEKEMVDRLQSLAQGWTFSVAPLEDARRSKLQQRLVPLAVFATVGVFLLFMVVLGLTGVMWQNVTRRTREIGLRRAAGASRSLVHRQIVMEVMIIAVFGVAIGAAIALQVPFVGPFSFLPMSTTLQAVVGSTIAILLLAGLCGLYPGWSATRIQPAEALHYE